MTRSLGKETPSLVVALMELVIPAKTNGTAFKMITRELPAGAGASLCTVRVYEDTECDGTAELSDAEMDILRDVLLDRRYDVARELTRGCAGAWRPSTARISLIDQGRHQYLIDGAVATSVWFIDLDCGTPPNAGYELRVFNDTDRDTIFRADLLLKVKS